MRRDSKLSGVLHVLLHMAEVDQPIPSDALAKIMRTNPVVIRRILAGLRDAGFVKSGKGHGGGWTIAVEFAAITLRDVYLALGSPELFAMSNRTQAPGCLVEQAVNAALDTAFEDATALILDRFGSIPLAQLSAEFHARLDTPAAPRSTENLNAV